MNSPTNHTSTESMARALELARLSPEVGRNPRVGCVLTDANGSILAEGYHHGAGHPHAEIEALRDAAAKGIDTRGLTAVVTLEPCNHEGLTGPCSMALIDAGISRVVFGAPDPGAVSSGGAHTLEHAGVEVEAGVGGVESEELNRHWFFAMRQQRPYVTAKWAQSLDGRSAAADQTSQWISSPASRSRVHDQRSRHGVIMVGTSTALVDNPSLTARNDDGSLRALQPHAVVMGMRDIPEHARVRNHPGGFQHIRQRDPHNVLAQLFADDYRSVYLEGGRTLMSAFVQADLVDEFHITMGPMLLGGDQVAIDDIGVATMAEAKTLDIANVEKLGSDIWVIAHPSRGEKE